MEAVKTRFPTLASETFSHGRKHYFIDVKKAANDTHFVLITSSEQFQNDPTRYRRTIQLWEEDLAMFVEALAMVLGRLAYGDLTPAEPKLKVVEDVKGVKALPVYDRPREKLHALGAGSLSNAELLAILLCTGSSELSVLDLCKRIMKSVKDEPARLLSRTAEDFCRFPGVGVAKAATLMASLELGRRAFLSAKD
ncbi:uncharacterized protein DUF3276 [Mucilaginibacter gracilis]|uniref:Uncharacterized protein DUF3276 n=1 Tax=Mucilaginibacter gracilis TaxID=423350 RepID=A0A495IZJ9_9SPHI|nr:UPF0758 domain-containing protein [Mucilaginibacter gracilis]RKR82145.1 uncharacterized protein DUF3276 [Mucilaginibacter gracilis]